MHGTGLIMSTVMRGSTVAGALWFFRSAVGRSPLTGVEIVGHVHRLRDLVEVLELDRLEVSADDAVGDHVDGRLSLTAALAVAQVGPSLRACGSGTKITQSLVERNSRTI